MPENPLEEELRRKAEAVVSSMGRPMPEQHQKAFPINEQLTPEEKLQQIISGKSLREE